MGNASDRPHRGSFLRKVQQNSVVYNKSLEINLINTVNMNRTKPIYETPLVRVEAVSTEHGFAGSGFGEAGAAGSQGNYIESGDNY